MPKSWPGGILIKCPNHLSWLFFDLKEQKLYSLWISELLTHHREWVNQPCREISFRSLLLMTLFFQPLPTAQVHRWGSRGTVTLYLEALMLISALHIWHRITLCWRSWLDEAKSLTLYEKSIDVTWAPPSPSAVLWYPIHKNHKQE